MLNLNSPTVQAMLANTPQGYGNMPVYYGNQPAVHQNDPTTTSGNGVQTPFPSPKEMLMQGGQQMIYSPTTFAPTSVVGAYNPGYQAAFAGYSNPYMGYGTYGGYGNSAPLDSDSKELLDAAIANGVTYDEQLENESKLNKTLSQIVSLNLGRSEEEAAECEKAFDIYCKYQPKKQEPMEIRQLTPIHVQIAEGDEVIADSDKGGANMQQNFAYNSYTAEQMQYRAACRDYEKAKMHDHMYATAPERAYDNTDMLDYFNGGVGVVISHMLERQIREQSARRTSQVYNSDNFRKGLLEANGIKTREQMNAVDRHVGRYGIMPDGRPVSPGHDPAIASSFSYDANTGQYRVNAPNFIQARLNAARESFIRSIDEG